MLQRKHTIYLLLTIVICVICLLIDPVTGFIEKDGHTLKVTFATEHYFNIERGLDELDSNPYIISFLILIMTNSILSILVYRNRKVQVKFLKINMVLSVVFGLAVYFDLDIDYTIKGLGPLTANPRIGFFLTVAIIILNWFALRGIIADEKLVKSMDRLR